MEDLGVRFETAECEHFDQLRRLFYELKKDKDAEHFREPDEWTTFLPEHARRRFQWPTREAREEWLERKPFTPIAIGRPAEQLGSRWDFHGLIEGVESAEYTLLSCELVDPNQAEMRIDAWAYPYGGLGPLIALVEAFGFHVVGINEYGRYEPREKLQNP